MGECEESIIIVDKETVVLGPFLVYRFHSRIVIE
jgi:hypothetical protein